MKDLIDSSNRERDLYKIRIEFIKRYANRMNFRPVVILILPSIIALITINEIS